MYGVDVAIKQVNFVAFQFADHEIACFMWLFCCWLQICDTEAPVLHI